MKKITLMIVALFTLNLNGVNVTWSFPPDAISAMGQTAENPQVGIDKNGNAVALWLENGLVKSSSKTVGMSWGAATTLSAAGATSPRLVVDVNGNATAAWNESGKIKVASKTISGNWSSSTSLTNNGAETPTLAVDSQGNVIVAWVRNGDIQSSRKFFGGSWQNTNSINTTGASLPDIAIGGPASAPVVAVVWQAIEGGRNVINASTKPFSQSAWGAKAIISDLAHESKNPRVGIDSDGNVNAIWFAYDSQALRFSNVVVQASTLPQGGNWGGRTSLSEPGIANPANLSLGISFDSLNNAIAVWNTSFDNENFAIQSAIKRTRKSWESEVDLFTDNLYALQGSSVCTSIGSAFSLHMFYNGGGLIIQSSEIDTTGINTSSNWDPSLNLSEATANAFPFIAASTNGNVIHTAAVWLNSDGFDNIVLASVGTKTVLGAPSNLNVVQNSNNFGVFTEYFNTLSWNASMDPKTVGYAIFRNGVYLETVDASTLQIVDHNQDQNGSVTYGVAAVDEENTHSPIITFNFPL